MAFTGWRSFLMALAPPFVVLAFLVANDLLQPGVAVAIAAAVLVGVALAARRRAATERAMLERLNRLQTEARSQIEDVDRKARVADRIVSSLPDPIFFLTADRRVARVNRAAGRVTDIDPIGRDLGEIIRDPGLIEGVDGALRDGGPRAVEVVLHAPVETSYLVRIEPLPEAVGSVLSMDTRDDARPDPGQESRQESRREARSGRTANDMPTLLVDFQDVTNLIRSERMRADFVANVSHELRTPLTSLIGFVETLQGPARDDENAREKFLAIMQEQASRMLLIIRDLLSLSRIELDEHSPPQDRVELQDVTTAILDTLGPTAAERGASIDVALDDGLPAVRGDVDQLVQVLQNLVENAIKYGGEGGVVTIVGSRHDAHRVSLAVSDTGPGIPAEYIPRLTERFYRVDAARSRDLGGTGLGLAIVKHIINRHRGRLTITSKQGVGSCFTVILPIAQD